MVQKLHNFRAISKPKKINKKDQHHYWPYLPLIVLVLGSIFFAVSRPVKNSGVLAFATNLSKSRLLEATNEQRRKYGVSNLTVSEKLTQAAQKKSDDMTNRNYWSHNTPDGHEPWVFIDETGYKYLKAGENLAYGFDSSNNTITGWMNSPSHKANLISSDFTEVGFGFTNSDNYVEEGEQTIVVAMYGRPITATVVQTSPAIINTDTSNPAPITTDTPIVSEPSSQQIARVQTLTGGRAPWAMLAVGLITGVAITFLLAKHTAGLRHFVRNGEKFVMRHPLIDAALLAVILIGIYLSQTTGFIR